MNNYIIYCAGYYGERTLLALEGKKDNRIVCFIDNSEYKQSIKLWGREVMDFESARSMYPNTKIIVANSSLSESWIIGEFLEQNGYVKGQSYFIANEMEAICEIEYLYVVRGIRRNLKTNPPIIIGDQVLIKQYTDWAMNHKLANAVVLSGGEDKETIERLRDESPNSILIPLLHTYLYQTEEDARELCRLYERYGLKNHAFFFVYDFIFCTETKDTETHVIASEFQTKYEVSLKNIIMQTSSNFCGTYFVNSLFDGHPNIVFLGNTSWGFDIYYIIKCLKDSDDICSDFKEIYEKYKAYYGEKWTDDLEDTYFSLLKAYFEKGKHYSELDILIGLHLVQYEMIHGRKLNGEFSIFIDPHSKAQDFFYPLLSWTDKYSVPVKLIKLVRRPIIRLGSRYHYFYCNHNGIELTQSMALYSVMKSLGDYADYGEHELIVVRFEDLKLHPRETLEKMVKFFDVPWDDSLMSTTMTGGEFTYKENNQYSVTGFDLRPVFNQYEDYFSPFDKMRLEFIYRFRNAAYGYPSVEEEEYPANLLDDQHLFAYPWKFERFMRFKNEEDRQRFRHNMQLCFNNVLELYKDNKLRTAFFKYNDYLNIGSN